MKYFISVFLFILVPAMAYPQSVSVSAVSAHSGNNLSSFPLLGGTVTSSNDNIRVQGSSETEDFGNVASWTLSPENIKVGLLSRGQELSLSQLDHNGYLLVEKNLEFFDPSDETLAIYMFDDGRAIVRDNVANFSFFDAAGEPQYSVSNSSQSSDGERESQLAADPAGRTIVLYNPVIAYGNQTGSQARLLFGNEDNEVFFRDRNRQVTDVKVSKNGALITLLVTSAGGDEVLVFDRFGSSINSIDLDAGQKGAVLSDNGAYLTVYSGSRAQVYNTLTGERLGSTSSRASIIYASYQPEDETIIILGGSENNLRISDPMITAVHLTQRQIAREDIGLSLSISDMADVTLERQGVNQFRIKGLNQHLDIRTSF
ncbi:MAG: hypothetical protein WEA56_04045 [Balneolaceae bacterium]